MEVLPEGYVPREALARTAARWRESGRRVVFTNGCFDLIHPGHISLLRDARAQGDLLLVAINDDDSVRRLKGASRPIYPLEQRAEILLALRWVDAVTAFAEDTPAEAIGEVRPHVLVKGSEYGSGEIVGEEFVTSYGGKVIRFPMRKGFATTNIVDRIAGKNGQPG
jgi:D-beta-D-heptose 7-phosphate kinase/D-beta-D-heptose 1-phosphate adenosyltransferase